MRVEGMAFGNAGAGAGPGHGLHLVGVRGPGLVHDVRVRSWCGAIARAQRVYAQFGSEPAAALLISLYLRAGRDEDAARQEQQLRLLMPELDEDALLTTRVTAYMKLQRLDEAEALLDGEGNRLDAALLALLRADLAANRGDWDEAIRQLEPVQEDRPLDPAAEQQPGLVPGHRRPGPGAGRVSYAHGGGA